MGSTRQLAIFLSKLREFFRPRKFSGVRGPKVPANPWFPPLFVIGDVDVFMHVTSYFLSLVLIYILTKHETN